jgi:hypothetical protein
MPSTTPISHRALAQTRVGERKLTDSDLREISNAFVRGDRTRDIARRFPVTPQRVSQLRAAHQRTVQRKVDLMTLRDTYRRLCAKGYGDAADVIIATAIVEAQDKRTR